MSVLPATVPAPGLLDRVKKKAKETIQQRTDQATDSVTNAAFDKAEHAVKCVVADKQCIRNAEAAGKGVAVINAQGQPVSSADSASAIAAANASTGSLASGSASPTLNATAADPHNDFTPGTDVLFQTDFADQPVGDFPRNVELKSGNAEIVNFNGGKYLRATQGATLRIPLPRVLPQRFTLEFDVLSSPGWTMHAALNPDPKSDNEPQGELQFSNSGDATVNPHRGARSGSAVGHEFKNQFMHAAVMADSDYVKVYINGLRLGNSPNAPLGRTKTIEIYLPADRNEPAMIGNIRVAAGGRDMYQALSTEGHFTTHGILFATGSAAIDPSSASTLSQIGQMLQQHPDLRLEIDGHTDNVGSAASNMTLSDQRAASVKQYLVGSFQIDPSRLTSKGFGATKPVAVNTTDDGRAQNRRVELVKL